MNAILFIQSLLTLLFQPIIHIVKWVASSVQGHDGKVSHRRVCALISIGLVFELIQQGIGNINQVYALALLLTFILLMASVVTIGGLLAFYKASKKGGE